MNTQRLSVIAAIVSLGLIGCDSKDPLSRVPSGHKSLDAVVEPEKKPTEPETPPKPELDRNTIPASLLTDAYKYYGLGNPKPMDIEIKVKPEDKVYTGTTIAHLNKVDKDGATFSAETTGSFHDLLGDDVAVLKPDGVYQVTSDKMTVSTPMLELPAKIDAGVKWKVDSVVSSNEQKSNFKLSFTSLGIKPVTLDGVSYQALNVVGEGTISVPGSKPVVYGVSEKEWFVKDIGMVRSEIVRTLKGKPTVTYVMVWKPEKKSTKP